MRRSSLGLKQICVSWKLGSEGWEWGEWECKPRRASSFLTSAGLKIGGLGGPTLILSRPGRRFEAIPS